MATDSHHFISFFLQQQNQTEREPDWRPATDVYRTHDGWLIKFELAGVEPEDIELTMRGRFVRVRGKRRDCCLEPGCRQLHMEISYSRFERQVELPAEVESLAFQTEFRHGMLLVRVQQEDRA
jgi:HSP20 family protein